MELKCVFICKVMVDDMFIKCTLKPLKMNPMYEIG